MRKHNTKHNKDHVPDGQAGSRVQPHQTPRESTSFQALWAARPSPLQVKMPIPTPVQTRLHSNHPRYRRQYHQHWRRRRSQAWESAALAAGAPRAASSRVPCGACREVDSPRSRGPSPSCRTPSSEAEASVGYGSTLTQSLLHP